MGRSIESFLITVWRTARSGGTRPEEAFYVKSDPTTMAQDDIDNGRLICYIGIAPVKPAEFVIFRIHPGAMRVPVLLTGLRAALYRLFP